RILCVRWPLRFEHDTAPSPQARWCPARPVLRDYGAGLRNPLHGDPSLYAGRRCRQDRFPPSTCRAGHVPTVGERANVDTLSWIHGLSTISAEPRTWLLFRPTKPWSSL